jgi:hypothetical protein
MTLQELLNQGLSDKEPARLQLFEKSWEIAHEPHSVSAFHDTQCSREREVPAQSDGPANLFVNQ